MNEEPIMSELRKISMFYHKILHLFTFQAILSAKRSSMIFLFGFASHHL